MENKIEIGKVVWVYKTGAEGEIVKKVILEKQTKYHVHVPSLGEVYVYSQEDLYVFGPMAENNIRREWAQTAS